MTYSQADDGLTSEDMMTRMEACEYFLKRPLEPERRQAIIRIFHDAWEAVHEVKEAAE